MLKQVAATYGGGVVMVMARVDDTVEFLGTGFLCHRSGYVLTSAHVLDLTASLHIVATQPINEFGKRTLEKVISHPVSVAQFDAVNDVALLKMIEGVNAGMPPNWIGKGNSVSVGTSVGVLGVPYGGRGLHTVKVTSTIISGKSITDDGTKQLHLDANIHEGNSGGPVIDVGTNQVVGIVSERYSPTGTQAFVKIGNFALGQDSTISFAVPIEYGVTLMKEEGLDV